MFSQVFVRRKPPAWAVVDKGPMFQQKQMITPLGLEELRDSRMNTTLSKKCGLVWRKPKKTYFQRNFTDFSRKHGIITAFR